MGYSTYGHIIAGYRLDATNLYKETSIQKYIGPPKYEDSKYEYHPITGKNLWRTVTAIELIINGASYEGVVPWSCGLGDAADAYFDLIGPDLRAKYKNAYDLEAYGVVTVRGRSTKFQQTWYIGYVIEHEVSMHSEVTAPDSPALDFETHARLLKPRLEAAGIWTPELQESFGLHYAEVVM